MSSDNPSSERTPLLGNDGTTETNGDTPQSKQSTLHRLQTWAIHHLVEFILGTLMVLFFAFFLVAMITRSPKDGNKAPPSPAPHGDKICTSTGCVLASSTLLRSISPRFVPLSHAHTLSSAY